MAGKLYTTPRDMIAFHNRLVREEKIYPKFPETLEMMRERGLLSDSPLPVPTIHAQMAKHEFREAYDRIPLEASQIIEVGMTDADVEESFIFPPGRDVFCVRHVHNFGEGEQYVNKFFELTYMYAGQCELLFGNEVIRMNEGDLCIITPGARHCIQPYADALAYEAIIRESTFNILFNEFLIAHSALSDFFRNALLKKEHENYCMIHTDPEDEELIFYLQGFTAECINENIFANVSAISLMKLFLAGSFRKYGDTIRMGSVDFHTIRPDADSILQYIRNNYRDITLTQTAEYFHYNRTYLSRLIHSYFHKSFMEIITDLKINNAKEYLRNTNRKITDIALLVGYDSADHFSRIFKQYVGLAPAFYRKKHRQSRS